LGVTDRTLDQDRVLDHQVQEHAVGPPGIIETQLIVGRAFAAHDLAHGQPYRLDQLGKTLARGRCPQVLDDLRLLAAVADHRQDVARGAALGVVVDGDGHGETVSGEVAGFGWSS
jgi:hypothetical protein